MFRSVCFFWVIFGSVRIVEVILGAITTNLYSVSSLGQQILSYGYFLVSKDCLGSDKRLSYLS